ncbi:NAD-dependent succinate-semialdehyde dehydrogenase [Algoriphagus sp. CAU 1675]|uniref:NAD-dependent succinate-semialdehyde dehydrogenase n=1 Tax=Algoriphagus sp. CAU 1675 TaxID=3032597 RepID=UPI0023DC9988|nr:NAD-dependent succinate-semialdehyde dehydrogenase [Algoriphagus sp. CAU 1675]MDF2157468.1 NAD-dependent succinate-semialdehyde dehydrogenase [Algoriphagus sp. CAU 1675]
MSKIKSIDPFNGKLLKEYNPLTESELEAKVATASDAFFNWRKTTLSERSKQMKNAAEVLRKNKTHYAKIISLEMGKVIREAISEVEKCAWVCDYYAENATDFLKEEQIVLPEEKKAKVIFQPLGTILAVMPWNFPFWQVFRFAAPTLMAGNVGLLKHASNVPECALAIEEVFTKAGFPKGVFQSLLIDSTTTQKIIADDRIQAVTLTGSEKAGAAVASAAGKHIKKSLLELGGSDPFIVLKDADLEIAVETAVKARMINFGQSCIAAKRFIVEEPVYEEFLKRFKEKIQNLKFGEPLSEDSDFACMARADLAEELYGQISKSVKMGARVYLGGEKPKSGSAQFSPTILTDIPVDSPAFSEELFGPVAIVFKAVDLEETIQLANATEFGLGASVWTKDPIKAEIAAANIESGAVFINSMVASNPHLPFGGIKKSGYGRELSRYGILEFVNTKTVYLG